MAILLFGKVSEITGMEGETITLQDIVVTGSGANMVVTDKLEHVYNIGAGDIPENISKHGSIKTWLIK